MEPRKLQRINWSSSEYFACAFVSRENIAEYYCLICDKDILGDEALDDHLAGKVHTSALLDFSACVTPYEDDHYYCSTCRYFFADYRSVYSHLTGPRHAQCRREKKPDATEVNWRSYKRFVCPQVLYEGSREYFCIICGWNIVDKASLTEHLLEEQHIENLQRNGRYLSLTHDFGISCSLCRVTMPCSKNVHPHLHGKTHFGNALEAGLDWAWKNYTYDDYYMADLVFHAMGEKYYCAICDCILMGAAKVNKHIRRTAHTNGMSRHCRYILLPEKYHILCSPCNRFIGGTQNIRQHVLGSNHARSLRENTSSVKLPPVDLTDNFLFQQTNGKYFCCICDRDIGDDEALKDHKKEKHHIDAAMKHGLRKTPSKMSKFSCSICDCSIRDYAMIYRHISGTRHARLVNDEASTQSSKPLPCDSNASEYFVAPFVSHEDIERYYCLLCGCDLVGDQSLNHHLQDTRHRDAVEQHGTFISTFKVDSCYCSSCDKFISSYTEVHNHIYAIQHQKILDKDKKAKKEEQRSIVSTSYKSVAEVVSQPNRRHRHRSYRRRSTSLPRSNDIESPPRTGNEESTSAECETSKVVDIPSKQSNDIHRPEDVQDLSGDMYDMKARVEEMRTGIELSYAIESGKMYCLICREMIDSAIEKYIDHLADSNHRAHLEKMKEDHARFDPDIGGFSEFDLARQYMEDISEIFTRCLVCDEEINHMESSLKDHVFGDSHRKRCDETKIKATQKFEAIAPHMECNWYKVQTYQCLVCMKKFNSEINFSAHLRSKDHEICLPKLGQAAKELIFNFCDLCALLWYGNRCTYASHSDSLTHQWLIRHENSVLRELPDSGKSFLAQSESGLEEMMLYLEDVGETEEAIYKRVMEDLRNTIRSDIPDVIFCTFGCRDINCSSSERYIDVFLRCESVYGMETSLDHEALLFMTKVNKCLNKDPRTWEFREFFTGNRSPVITIRHRSTGVSCEICFEIGLVVDGKKLIRFFNDIFPQCGKLLIFLKRWLTLCNLAGHQHLSIYTLYWSLVFYLQTISRLPSIASLITDKRGCVFGILSRNRSKASRSIKELLMGYFEFYANFEFRYDVACPFLGHAVKKEAFEDLRVLPKEMESYLVHMEDSDKPEPFQIECAMCIQDPFRLQHNLTSAVSKGDLVRFRTCCSMSLEKLRST